MIKLRIYKLILLFLIFASIIAEVQAEEKELAAYWSFDEGKGNFVEDLSGNGNDATINGQYDWVEGIAGKAIGCKGSTVVDCGKGESLEIPQNITAEFWMKPDKDIDEKLSRIDIFYMHWGPMFAFNPTWGKSPGSLTFWFDGPNPKPVTYSKTRIWQKDTWYYIVGTYDGSSVKLYVNSEEEASLDAKGNILDRDQPLRIGKSFVGAVDEARIYSRALTAQEIKRNYKRILRGGETVDLSGKLPLTWGGVKNYNE